MILVDTSIWIDYMRGGNDILAALLTRGRVKIHPFVIGEIALGGARQQVIADLQELPRAEVATDSEVLDFIQRHQIAGRGIGYVDAHLLASSLLTDDPRLWTLDKSLRSVAEEMSLFAKLSH